VAPSLPQGHVRPIRVVFANEVSRLTRALLRKRFAEYHDLEVVEGADLKSTAPSESPPLLAVTVADTGVLVFEVHAHNFVAAGDPSAEALISAIRDVASHLP
jgi:hypothetical protein